MCKGHIKSEVSVSTENNEKIDVVDLKEKIAYELKVSGKNNHHEFYKDLVKILTYKEYQPQEFKIIKLFFISESEEITSLKGRLYSKFIELVRSVHNLVFELIGIYSFCLRPLNKPI